MRIAFFVNQFPSLSETFILNQVTGLVDRGHCVDIYASHRGMTDKAHPDVAAYRLLERCCFPDIPRRHVERYLTALRTLARHGLGNPKACARALFQRLRGKSKHSLNMLFMMEMFRHRKSYDVIQCHFGPQGLKAQLLRDLGVIAGPLVTVFHGADITSYVRRHGQDVYSELFEKGSFFLPISEHWRRKAIEMGCPPQKLRVHHMGISVNKFPYARRPMSSDGQVRIVTIARLVEKKGVEYAIRAVARLRGQGRMVEYRVLGDGPLRARLEQLVDELQIGQAVHLLGWRDEQEVRAALGESDILLAPSVTSSEGDQEGIPVVLMEALAMRARRRCPCRQADRADRAPGTLGGNGPGWPRVRRAELQRRQAERPAREAVSTPVGGIVGTVACRAGSGREIATRRAFVGTLDTAFRSVPRAFPPRSRCGGYTRRPCGVHI